MNKLKITKMIKFLLFILIIISFACIGNGSDNNDNGNSEETNYKQYMRDFVINISSYGKSYNSDFVIIPQNGQNLLTVDGNKTNAYSQDYINAIDGIGREDLFYGYTNDNLPTPDQILF